MTFYEAQSSLKIKEFDEHDNLRSCIAFASLDDANVTMPREAKIR